MDSITSVAHLIQLLIQKDPDDYRELVHYLQIPTEAWQEYASFSKSHYTRNCVARTDKYELLLLCWEKDQITPIHCHNKQECWVYVVEGTVQEPRYRGNPEGLPVPDDELRLKQEGLSYMNDEMRYHRKLQSYDAPPLRRPDYPL